MFVHAYEIREQALALVEAGENDCEVARRLGVARTEPHWPLRVPFVRVQQPIPANPRALHGRMRPGWRRVPPIQAVRADLPPGERVADGAAHRFEAVTKR